MGLRNKHGERSIRNPEKPVGFQRNIAFLMIKASKSLKEEDEEDVMSGFGRTINDSPLVNSHKFGISRFLISKLWKTHHFYGHVQ